MQLIGVGATVVWSGVMTAVMVAALAILGRSVRVVLETREGIVAKPVAKPPPEPPKPEVRPPAPKPEPAPPRKPDIAVEKEKAAPKVPPKQEKLERLDLSRQLKEQAEQELQAVERERERREALSQFKGSPSAPSSRDRTG